MTEKKINIQTNIKKCLVHNEINCNKDKCTNKECENLDTIDNQLFCDLYFNQVGDI